MSDARVVATVHSAERALLRVPHLHGDTRFNASRWVEGTVTEALAAGRKAKRMPRWCSRTIDGIYYRGHAPRRGTSRFVWNASETVAFVCTRTADKDGEGALWIVRTVMVANELADHPPQAVS